VADCSSAALRTELAKRKRLSENDVSKLVLPSHHRLLANPKEVILSKPVSTDSDWREHHASSESDDSMHRPSRLWRPIQTFRISSFQWVKTVKISISGRLP